MTAKYRLLAHFLNGVAPVALAHKVLSQWNTAMRPPLFLHKEHRKVAPITSEIVQSCLTFKDDKESSFLRLASGRGRDADQVEFYFGNPLWKYERPLNYCSIEFSSDKVDMGLQGYRIDDLTGALAMLALNGPMESGYVESTRVLNDAQFKNTRRTYDSEHCNAWPSLLYWITFVPDANRSQLNTARKSAVGNINIEHDLGKHGIIVTVNKSSCMGTSEYIAVLTQLNRTVGIL
jgi:hypothetical protein